MRLWRSGFICIFAGLALLTSAHWAAAQQYPAKPIRIVVPFGAGSITDFLTRLIGQHLGQALGQPVTVDNKPGADGTIGALDVKRAAPDGYTLFMSTNSPMSVVPHIQKTPPYDPLVDFTPIVFIGSSTFIVVAHPSVPAKTLPELFAHAKANPNKLFYASGNTTGIVGMALLAKQAGVEMKHVPYKSEPPAIPDLISGQVHVMLATTTTTLPHVQEGKLRALATILPQRSPLLPDVPSMVEHGLPKFPVGPWAAIVGPAGMPKEIVQRLNREVIAVLDKPEVKAAMVKQGMAVAPSTPESLGIFLKDQLAVWKETLKVAGIEAQ